jgi:hypothetical protein
MDETFLLLSEQFRDEDNVLTDKGFEAFLDYATSHLYDVWCERNGNDLGTMDEQILRNTLYGFFAQHRKV